MKSALGYLNGYLCILNESGLEAGTTSRGAMRSVREWYAVREVAEAEVATLLAGLSPASNRTKGCTLTKTAMFFSYWTRARQSQSRSSIFPELKRPNSRY
jgi:hypothetical protein